MKKILLLLAAFALLSCTEDCEKEAQELLENYNKSIEYSNGNPDSIRELQRQYSEAKSKLDC